MEYTKSQILKITEEQKPIIFKALETIDENVAYIRTEEGYNIKCQLYVDGALEKLSKAFEIISDLIVDTDDYPLGVEIFEKLMPVWRKYCTGATRGLFRIHEAAYKVQSIINYFEKWIKKQEQKTTVYDSLAAFEKLAHDCIAFIGLKYGTRKEKPNSQDFILKQRDSYRKMAPVSELTYEVKKHIENCKTQSEIDLYICSLLLPFKELCEVLRPSVPSEESQTFIKLLCTGFNYHGKDNPDSIERVLRGLLNDMNKFAKGLYDVLIQNGIDLNKYQQKTGVYLRREWNPAEGLYFELDNWDLIKSLSLEDAPSESLSQEDAPSESQSDISNILNDKILNALPDIYDYLRNDGVIGVSLTKVDFINCISKGVLTSMKKEDKHSSWIKKIAKMKEFIKCIKPYFNDNWYISVYTSAGLTERKIQQYNTDNTADLEKDIMGILKRFGVQ